MVSTRVCTKCHKERLEIDFHVHSKYWCKECTNTRTRKLGQEYREQVIRQYGSRCTNCGKDFFEALVIDHIEDNGTEERTPSGHRRLGANLYRELKKRGWPSGYQVLCYDCNNIKQTCPEKLEEYAEYMKYNVGK